MAIFSYRNERLRSEGCGFYVWHLTSLFPFICVFIALVVLAVQSCNVNIMVQRGLKHSKSLFRDVKGIYSIQTHTCMLLQCKEHYWRFKGLLFFASVLREHLWQFLCSFCFHSDTGAVCAGYSRMPGRRRPRLAHKGTCETSFPL